MQENIGGCHKRTRPIDAFLFDFAACGAKTGRIHEAQNDAVQIKAFLDGVARRSRLIGDNGTIRPQQRIEKRGFSGIGGTGQNQKRPLAKKTPLPEGADERIQFGQRHGKTFAELRRGQDAADILIGKIERRLQIGTKRHQTVVDGIDARSERARKQLGRGSGRPFAAGADKIHDRLRFFERQTPVEKRTTRKFARRGR